MRTETEIDAKEEHRTVSEQIEFWALVGRTALDNPDLSIDFRLLRPKETVIDE